MKRIYKIIALCICFCMAFPAHSIASENETGEIYGLFGRAADDASISVAGGEMYTAELEQSGSAEEDSILLQWYAAWEKYSDKKFSVALNGGTADEKKELVRLTENGEVFLCNSSVKKGIMLTDRWYKLSVSIAKNGDAILYIDGYYTAQKNLGISGIESISSFFAESAETLYIDDITAKTAEKAEIAALNLSHADKEISAGMVKSVSTDIFVGSYVSVGEFMSGFETGDASVTVRNADGTEISSDSGESVYGKYFVLETENVSPVYLKAETDTADLKSVEGKQVKYNGKGFVWEKVTGGTGGRNADEELYHMGQQKTSDELVSDGILTSSQANSWRDNGITFMPGKKGAADEYYPVTLEGSFYFRGEETLLTLNAKLLNSAGAGVFKDLLRMNADGTVKLIDGNEISLVPDEYNYISCTVFPGEKAAVTVRVNGETAAYAELGSLPQVASMKTYIEITGGSKWGEVWMTDWDVYTGACRDKRSAAETSVYADDDSIEIDSDTVSMAKSFTAGELLACLSVNNGAEKRIISKDHPKKQLADNAAVTADACLVVADKGIYKYYNLTYSNDKIPIMEIKNYSDGQSVTLDSMEKLKVAVSGTYEITKLDLYINNVLTESAYGSQYEFDISSAGSGKHIIRVYAENSEGYSSEISFTLKISNSVRDVKFQTDFESYVSGMPNGFGSGAIQKGYMESAVLGTNESKCFVLGIDKDRMQFEHTQGSWIGFNTSAEKKYSFEFDAYFDSVKGCSIDLKKEGVSPWGLLRINDGKINANDNTGKTFASVPYTDKTWYRVRLDFDIPEHRYSLYVAEADGKLAGKADGISLPDSYDVIDWLRLCGPNDENVKSLFAIDNVEYSVVYDCTEILSVGYDGTNKEPIDFECKTINAYMSEMLEKETISADNIKLYDGNTEIALSSVSYDEEKQAVSVQTDEKLKSSTEYTLNFTDRVKDGNGMSAQTVYSFRTKANDVEFEQCTLKDDEFRCKAVNCSDEAKTAYIIVKVSKGNELVSVKVYKNIVQTGTSRIVCPVSEYGDGDKVSVYIWDSLKFPKSYISYAVER